MRGVFRSTLHEGQSSHECSGICSREQESVEYVLQVMFRKVAERFSRGVTVSSGNPAVEFNHYVSVPGTSSKYVMRWGGSIGKSSIKRVLDIDHPLS